MKLKGKCRQVVNKKTGQESASWWPVTRAEAFMEGLAFYWPWGDPPCDVPSHAAGTSIVYTVSDVRKCCAIDNAAAAYRAAVAAGEPINPTDAGARGLDYYWNMQPGAYCGHVGKVTLSGRCWECRQGIVNSPRQQAIAAGVAWYTPVAGDECGRCGTLARRRVVNGSCEECERQKAGANGAAAGSKIDIRSMVPLDTIISRADAVASGFLVYRTGSPCKAGHTAWRYVSTGGCLACMGRG